MHRNDKSELLALAGIVLSQAEKLGASSTELSITAGNSVEVGVHMGKLESLQGASSQVLNFKAYVGKRSARVTTADLRQLSLKKLIEETIAIARVSQEDPDSGPAGKEEFAGISYAELDLFDGEAAALPVEKKIELVMAAERAALEFDPRIVNTRGASFADSQGLILRANSEGLCAAYEVSNCSFSVGAIAQDESGMQIDQWGSNSRKFSSLLEPSEIGKIAAERALRQLGSRGVKSQSCPIVLDPAVAAQLLSEFVGAAAGAQIYRKNSFLLGLRGEIVASPLVEIIDDPLIVAGLASRPFDDEGLVSRTRSIVSGGKLNCYLMGVYSARKLGETPNGGFTSNLYLKAGNSSAEDIIASVKQGLLITTTFGHGFNVTTGDYSVGAAGFMIENGKIGDPVSGFTIAGNVLEIFKGIEAVGNDLQFLSAVNAPTIKIASMTVAGI